MNLGISGDTVYKLFQKIDDSDDGQIQMDEFLEFFGAIESEAEMKETLAQYDVKAQKAKKFYPIYTAVFGISGVICLNKV